MKKFIFCLLLISVFSNTVAQKLNYRVRTFGIGFFGNIGGSYPLAVDHRLGTKQIEPAFLLLNDPPKRFEDFQGNDIEEVKNTYTLGAMAHYKHSFGRNFMFTLLGGYAKTQVSHYLVNLAPLNSRQHAFDAWHEWYNFDHYFAGVQLALPFGKKMGRFLNLGCNAALTNITEPFFQRDVRAYPGITKSGTRAWNDPSINEGFTFTDEINEDVLYLSPSLKYLIQFGPYNSHAFELGFSYSFALFDNLITTDYQRFEGDILVGRSQLNYKGEHWAVEMSYVFPLFRSKRNFKPKQRRLRRARKPKPQKRSKVRRQGPSPQAQEDPILQQMKPDLNSCYNTVVTDNVRYEENHFKFNQNTVDFELYHKDGLDDGDIVTICVDGRVQMNKIRLTDRGTRFSVNTQGKKEINIIIYTESQGSQGNISLGLSLLRGGQVNTIEKDAFVNTYYLFKMERE